MRCRSSDANIHNQTRSMRIYPELRATNWWGTHTKPQGVALWAEFRLRQYTHSHSVAAIHRTASTKSDQLVAVDRTTHVATTLWMVIDIVQHSECFIESLRLYCNDAASRGDLIGGCMFNGDWVVSWIDPMHPERFQEKFREAQSSWNQWLQQLLSVCIERNIQGWLCVIWSERVQCDEHTVAHLVILSAHMIVVQYCILWPYETGNATALFDWTIRALRWWVLQRRYRDAVHMYLDEYRQQVSRAWVRVALLSQDERLEILLPQALRQVFIWYRRGK